MTFHGSIVGLLALVFFGDGALSANEDARPAIIPKHYRIRILPQLEEGDFRLSGSVALDFAVAVPTDRIVLHAANLTLGRTISVESAVRLIPSLEGDPLEVQWEPNEPRLKYNVTYETERETVVIQLPWTLVVGQRYRINVTYDGWLTVDSRGLHRSHYYDRITGSKRWLAVSQMDPTGARLVFPCLDDPTVRATFEIVIGRTENTTSVSNMPLVDTTPMHVMGFRLGNGRSNWYWDRFETTPPMSTNELALLVSDFDVRHGRRLLRCDFVASNNEEITTTSMRVWAPRDRIDQANVSVAIAPVVLEYLEYYFQVNFSPPKIDMVALPDLTFTSMNHRGFIAFKESDLLVDPGSSTISDEMHVEQSMANELALHWFDSLIATKCWNELWLKQSMAVYVARLVVDNVSPKYQFGIQQGLSFLDAMEADASPSSHPLSHQPPSIIKGCAVVHMVNHFLGETTFRQGMTNYLTQRHSRPEKDDVWHFLTHQARVDGVLLSADADIKRIVDTWTSQKGFPLISVTRNYENASIRFEQESFTYLSGKSAENATLSYRWWVPISYTDADEKYFGRRNTQPRLWLSPEKVQVSIATAISSASWIVANVQGSGFYRVNYDERNWRLLADQLRRHHKAIHVMNRAHLISDAFALAAVDILPYSTPFLMIKYLVEENHFVPWSSAFRALDYIGSMMQQTSHYGDYQAYVLSLTVPAYLKAVSRSAKEHVDPAVTLTLKELMERACFWGYHRCIQACQYSYGIWMKSADPVHFSWINPELRQTTYCTAIKYGDKREWDFAWRMALNATTVQHRDVLLSALGCSREAWILTRYLWKSLDPHLVGLPRRDGAKILFAVASTAAGRTVAFDFLHNHFDELVDAYTVRTVLEAISAVTKTFHSDRHLRAVEELLDEKSEALLGMQSFRKKMVNTISTNAKWMERNLASLAKWLTNINH